jgi:group I intron endonuclease
MVVYIIINLVNGKQYIGRDAHNKKSYFGGGTAIKEAIKKYGKENFRKDILEYCDNKDHLLEREHYWLNYYNAAKDPNFYNMTNKSEKGWEKGKERPERKGKRLSEETRKLISQNGKGKKKNSGEKTPVTKYRYEIIKISICEYNSIKEASQDTGISTGDIVSTCRGRQLTAGGFIWEYKKK